MSSDTASKSFRRFSACCGLPRRDLQPLQLGDALDEFADRRTEELVDLGARRAGVFDRVVKESGGDRGIVKLQIGQDRRDFERMREIRVAGRALLRAVLLHGVDVGAVQELFVDLGVIRRHPFDELVLAHHLQAVPQRRKRASQINNIGAA